MGFLDEATLSSLEGKYLQFVAGVPRTFVLKGHTTAEKKGQWGAYTQHLFKVTEGGEEKEFTGSKRFLQAIVRVNHLFDIGKEFIVTPTASSFKAKDGTQVDTLDFEITMGGTDAPAETASEAAPF